MRVQKQSVPRERKRDCQSNVRWFFACTINKAKFFFFSAKHKNQQAVQKKGNPIVHGAQWGSSQKYCVNSDKAEAKSKSQLCFSSVCATLMWAKATQDKPQTDNKQARHKQGQTHTTRLTHTHTLETVAHSDRHTNTHTEREKEHTHAHSICHCLHCGQRKQSRSIIKAAFPPLPLPPSPFVYLSHSAINAWINPPRGLIPPHSSVICIS